MKKNIKTLNKILILILLFLLYIFVSSLSYANKISKNLSNEVFRLHVIANSDSADDQNLKLLVRDNVIKYMNVICKDSSSKEETIQIVNNHLEEFRTIANNTITQNGYSYEANVKVGNFEFPTKQYGDISFPAGYYDALKIKIGKAQGQNWWCVLYPSLCFIDMSTGIVPEESKEELKDNLTDEEYTLISEHDTPTIKFKFKLVEFFAKNKY